MDKKQIDLSKFNKVSISREKPLEARYIDSLQSLGDITTGINIKGYVWLDKDNVVAVVTSCKKLGENWLGEVLINKDYEDSDVKEQVVKSAIKSLEITYCNIPNNDTELYSIFSGEGFVVFRKTDTDIFMTSARVFASQPEEIEVL